MRLIVACCLSVLLLAGCSSAQLQDAATTFIVVRHAEKADDGSRDPPLSAVGCARAQSLALRLHASPLAAAYATPFRRTQQIARPSAADHGIAVATYDPAIAASDVAAMLRARHHRGTVLVVGHSNSVPALVAALCSCRIAAMGENEFDALYTIRVDAGGHAALDAGRQ
jgi:broad specificity phosphatase PhoE